MKLHLRTFGMHLMAVLRAAAERVVLIKKKERKESSAAFIKVFRHTSNDVITHPGIARFRSNFVRTLIT